MLKSKKMWNIDFLLNTFPYGLDKQSLFGTKKMTIELSLVSKCAEEESNALSRTLIHNIDYNLISNSVNKTIVYKAPGQDNGKIILATAAGAWNDGAQALSSDNGHSFATALQHVVRDNGNIKFLAYNNAPPGVANVKTKSNSKDSAAWIVHTVPGFPAAKTGYSWPVAENARGHLLICLTILESQINAIAASLLLVQPLIHYNDIPKTETAGMPYFNKLAEGKIPTLPPYTSRQTIRTQDAGNPVTVHIYSKSESSKYEIYKKVIVKVLKKTIKVWSRRDRILKGDCRGSQRHIRLIKSPAAINGHNTNFEADITNWVVSDPGNIFCHIDKPYFKNQTREPAMAVCIDNGRDINSSIHLFNYKEKMLKFSKLFALFFVVRLSHSQTSTCQNKQVYKAPGQNTGKIIFPTAAGSWDDGAQPLNNANQHSFAKALEHVVANNNNNIKFIAYNNVPPGVPSVKTKSNSKGVIILSTAANSAAWIVHTVPGFPTARTPYSWPAAEDARGHLLICLTISKSQINAIAASLLLVQPMVHYNDIPETETAGMPYFNKLAEGKITTLPPFTSRRSIRTENARGPVAVQIYSKSESSKYEIYKKVIVKVLKKTIKVWSRRDNILKGDCRGSQRHIRLIKSPAAIDGHNTNLEADITNWAVSDPGNIFCHIDKPYFKNQTREPAMAVCIDNNEIFARFNEIAAQRTSDKSIGNFHNEFRAILYKAPGQATGKIIEATAAAGDWQDGARALSNPNQHSFATALQHVVGDDPNAKFLAYNNAPPGVPSIKTKSNSKGVIILATNADSAAWIVHTDNI
ncbi:Deoxyribonuclease-2-alpha [Trichinella murrelli]|uniref:Deoxyribonuclease-2-alpha n=1 Tax=Trichinella murrelli TaxID=144512 RepID=A0A0V0TEW3_9BILA|nr:Deoxyribonuclease-2-alpha [Trichinella murrelli]